jgi:tRNA-Thr(GGU) m(6)t(6)A37 methyltransferase TsaA
MRWLRRLLDWLRGLLGIRLPAVPREPVVLQPIGVVRNRERERHEGWESIVSDVIIRDDLLEALDGIETYSHIIVVFHLHQVPEEERTTGRIHPRGDPQYPLQGVLATRSQRRPNGIGVSVVPLLRRRHNILRVRGLDARNGTPVLDIKPYLPPYDSVPDAEMPAWAR